MSVFEEMQLRKQNTALSRQVEELSKQLEDAEAKLQTADGSSLLDKLAGLDAELAETEHQIAVEADKKRAALESSIRLVDKKQLKNLIARLT